MTTGHVLDVVDLRTTFDTPRGPLRAVDGVSLRLDRGRTLGLVGESGSGKTVLARSIMGLLPRRGARRSGSVRLDGEELVGRTPAELRTLWGDRMAMVFQDPRTSLNPVLRIGRQLTEGIRAHADVSRDFARAAAVELLDSVGIPEPRRRMRQYPHQLSGGMRQRVMIAIALASGPQLLFADEPTTALDATVQAQILDLLARQQDERNMAMMLVTHDLGVVAGRTDEVAVMYAGRLVEQAPTRTLFAAPRMPYTEALLASTPRLSLARHARLAAIPGRPPDLVRPPSGCRFAPRCAYAQDRCGHEEPPLQEASPGHRFRCLFPVGTPEGRAALEANRATGRPGADAALGDRGPTAGTTP